MQNDQVGAVLTRSEMLAVGAAFSNRDLTAVEHIFNKIRDRSERTDEPLARAILADLTDSTDAYGEDDAYLDRELREGGPVAQQARRLASLSARPAPPIDEDGEAVRGLVEAYAEAGAE